MDDSLILLIDDKKSLNNLTVINYLLRGTYDVAENTHLSFTQGAGHGGSHPHLAHEFLMALVENRDPFPNAAQSANWTSVGILAHESAMEGGAIKYLPDYFNV